MIRNFRASFHLLAYRESLKSTRIELPGKCGEIRGIGAQPGTKIFAAFQHGKNVEIKSTTAENDKWEPVFSVFGTFKQMAIGRTHVLILTADHRVHSVGSNSLGQRGLGSELKTPISEITCGHDHSLIRASDGRLYSTGWNSDGQCGQGSAEDMIDGFKLVSMGDELVGCLKSSADHSLAVTVEGKQVFAWGNNEYQQCGLGIVDDKIVSPTLVPIDLEDKETITQVACGNPFSVIMTDKRVIYHGFGPAGLIDVTRNTIKTVWASGDYILYEIESQSSAKFIYEVCGKILGEIETVDSNSPRIITLESRPKQVVTAPDQIVFLIDDK